MNTRMAHTGATFGKIARGFGIVFGILLTFGVLAFTSYGLGTIISDYYLAPEVPWKLHQSWTEQHHVAIGRAISIFFFVGVVCLIYMGIHTADEADKARAARDAGCNQSCKCPRHSWNQSQDGTNAAIIAASVATTTAVIAGL